MLTQIETAPAEVPLPPRDAKKATVPTKGGVERIPEEQTTDVNHSLTWLLREMADTEVAEKLEERLLAVRGRLAGWWRQEMELAMEMADVEQNRALRAALPRMKGVEPIRSDNGLRHSGRSLVSSVAITADGAFLATSGGGEIRVWNTEDWHRVSTIPQSPEVLTFSPAAQSLFVLNYGEQESTFSRYAWRTGHQEKAFAKFSGQLTEVQFSRDTRVMLPVCYTESQTLWDTVTGGKLRSFSVPRRGAAVALSPDGQRLARQTVSRADAYPKVSESVIETLAGKRLAPPLKFDFQVDNHAFTPDGRYLLSSGAGESKSPGMDSELQVESRDLTTGAVVRAAAGVPARFPSTLVVSPKGNYVGFCDQNEGLFVYRLPGLELVVKNPFWAVHSPRKLAFSPDDKMLIAAGNRETPYFLRMETLEEFFPYPGHPGKIQGAYFSADNQQLWSIGEEGTICHWDAATMKMRRRIPVPAGFHLASIREPDGKYALFVDGSINVRTSIPQERLLIVDAETGAEVSRLAVSIDGRSPIGWLPNGELLSIGGAYGQEAVTLLDYLGSRIIARIPFESRGGLAFLAKDRQTLLMVPQGFAPDRPTLVHFATGEITHPVVEGTGDIRTVQGRPFTLLETWQRPKNVPPVRQVEAYSALSPDGRRMAVITGDRWAARNRTDRAAPKSPTIRVHDAATLEMLFAFPIQAETSAVRFNADGTQLAVANSDGTIERWPLPR